MLQKWCIPVLSPAHCYACKKLLEEYTVLCGECAQKMQPIISHEIEITTSKKITVFALSAYTEPLSKLIRAKNYHDYTAAVSLGKLMGAFIQQQRCEYDYIVPVPLHWSRHMWRRYNQASVIAQEIAEIMKKPVVFPIKRIKRTKFQALLNRGDRMTNMHSAFRLTKQAYLLEGKKILIIDDLMTSGSTIKTVSKLLLQAKPAQLIAFVAARVIQ